MSQPWQQPQDQNQQPGAFGGPAPAGQFAPQVPQRSGNAALGIIVAVVAAAVLGIAYAYVLKATFNEDKGEVTQIGYVAIIVGALIGAAAGKLAGRNIAVWVIGAVLALASVFLGELYGYALIMNEYVPGAPATTEIFFEHFGDLFDGWKEDADALNYIFFLLAPAAAASVASRTGR